MPLYEYQCRKCKHRFERIQKFSDPIVKTCPECGATVDQLLSAPAVHFKGAGWYVTDYAGKGSGKGSGEAAGGKTGGENAAGAESKPESKPKAESKPKSEPASRKSHDKKK
jgi:putative FmdB family regulatory protein